MTQEECSPYQELNNRICEGNLHLEISQGTLERGTHTSGDSNHRLKDIETSVN